MKIIGHGRYLNEGELRDLGLRTGRNVMVHEMAILVDVDRIELGSDVRIDAFTIITGDVKIGSHVHMAAYACIFGAGGVEVGDFCGISQRVAIYSVTDDYSGAALTGPTIPKEYLNIISGPVRLGRHSVIGSGSVVLPNVTVGEGSAVGALSLVNQSLDEWGVYVGCPARRVKDRKRDLLEMEKQLLARE
jgi:galactoside O-acetyltransferase